MPEAATPPVLLDTCAAIWLANGDRMTASSRQAIAAAQRSGAGVQVSPITAWEIGTLVARNPGVRLAPMPPELLIASAFLPGTPPRDPADRIIAATSRAYGLSIVTRDKDLIPYGRAGHITTIPC